MRTPATLLLALALAGCLAPAATLGPGTPMALPDDAYWDAAFDPALGYHTLEDLQARIDAIAALAPGIVRVETLGESREARPLRALVFENRAVPGPKPAPFIDGGHHANEVEGIEVTLYLAEFLARNYATNATVRAMVDGLETWIVPLVNPDGYVVQSRFNAAHVNLNRNYDLDWCNPAGWNSCPPGPVEGAFVQVAGDPTPEYAGTGPFSEPESSAIRDAVLALGDRLAFYVSHHTPAHCIAQPWTAPNPPFPVPEEHQAAFDAAFGWIRDHTEYGAGRWTWAVGECMSYSVGGASQDWAYSTARKPAFTMEVGGTPEYEGGWGPMYAATPPPPYERSLARWMPATLPVELFLLANAAALQGWSAALEDPLLPDGVQP